MHQLTKLEVAYSLMNKIVRVVPDDWVGTIIKVVNEEEFIVSDGTKTEKVNIFDIRTPFDGVN